MGAGFYDFAGSGVVHMVGGFGALAGAMVAGPRFGRFAERRRTEFEAHNMPFVIIGMWGREGATAAPPVEVGLLSGWGLLSRWRLLSRWGAAPPGFSLPFCEVADQAGGWCCGAPVSVSAAPGARGIVQPPLLTLPCSCDPYALLSD